MDISVHKSRKSTKAPSSGCDIIMKILPLQIFQNNICVKIYTVVKFLNQISWVVRIRR